MKIFIPLAGQMKYNGKDFRLLFRVDRNGESAVHGFYENDEAVKAATKRLYPANHKKMQFLVLDCNIVDFE